MRILPPAVTLGIALWGIREPSLWRDEASTLAAVQRPFGALVRMLGNVDAVHGCYYLMIWTVARLAGTGELAVRLPSVAATVLASVAVTALGRRLVSPRAGFAAGMLFAALPEVSFFGQDARSYAMVGAMAVTASYLLVRLLDAEPGRSRRWLAGYAAALAAMGLLNIFALLLIPAHAVTVAVRCLRTADQPRGRRLALGWLTAATAATLAVGPLLVLGWSQRHQISWLTVNDNQGVNTLERLIGPSAMAIAAGVVVAIAIWVSARAGRGRLRAVFPPLLPVLCVPWLLLPAAILLGISVFTPIFTFRYIFFCVPAAALLGGAAIAALGRVAGTIALVVVVLFGFHAEVVVREPDGHGDDIRQADQIVTVNSRPGDVVLYTNVNAEDFGAAYPSGLGQLRNIEQRTPAIPSGTLAGTNVTSAVLRRRLARVSRLWIVEINKLTPVPQLHGTNFRLHFQWQTGDIWLLLYARPTPAR
jgi:mannosyltransferase